MEKLDLVDENKIKILLSLSSLVCDRESSGGMLESNLWNFIKLY